MQVTPRALTVGVAVVSVAALVIYDVVIIAIGGTAASISDVVTTAAFEHPALPFAVGFLAGHWFFGGKPKGAA